MKTPKLRIGPAALAAGITGLALVVLLCVQVFPVLADAGGWPTNTPRPRPTNTPVPLIVIPTPTFTLAPVPIQITPAAALAVAVTNTPVPRQTGGAAMACLPLAVILILAVVVGATYMLYHRNRQQGTVQNRGQYRG